MAINQFSDTVDQHQMQISIVGITSNTYSSFVHPFAGGQAFMLYTIIRYSHLNCINSAAMLDIPHQQGEMRCTAVSSQWSSGDLLYVCRNGKVSLLCQEMPQARQIKMQEQSRLQDPSMTTTPASMHCVNAQGEGLITSVSLERFDNNSHANCICNQDLTCEGFILLRP